METSYHYLIFLIFIINFMRSDAQIANSKKLFLQLETIFIQILIFSWFWKIVIHFLATRPAHQMLFPTMNPRLYNAEQVRANGQSKLFYPYDESDYMKGINSMKQFHDQPLPFRLPFFGFAFNYIWVNHYTITFNFILKINPKLFDV